MDESMIQSILQRKGGADNPENRNRIIQFAASNPNVLEHYGAGMSGSTPDDNSALLQLIAKQMDSVDGNAALNAPENAPPPVMPTVQAASAPTRRSATAAPASRMPPFEGPPIIGDPLRGAVNEATPANPGVAAPPGGGGMGIGDWLAVLLGAGATARAFSGPPANANARGAGAGAAGSANRRALPAPTETPALPAPVERKSLPMPPKQLTNQSGPAYESGAPKLPQTPEMVDELRAQVAADNAATAKKEAQSSRRLMEQMRAKQMQDETMQLLKAGRRATGRK